MSLLAFLHEMDKRVREFDRGIDRVFRESEARRRITPIRAVGPKTATAVVAAVGDGGGFDSGSLLDRAGDLRHLLVAFADDGKGRQTLAKNESRSARLEATEDVFEQTRSDLGSICNGEGNR